MGQTTSKPSTTTSMSKTVQFSIQLLQYKLQPPGVILENELGNTMYFLRQLISSSNQQHKQLYSMICEYGNALKQCPDIIQMIRVKSEQSQSMCNSMYKISILYQYSVLTLEEEIDQRCRHGKYFQLGEVWKIVMTGVNALSFMNKFHMNSNVCPYQSPMITPKSILIMNDHTIRVMDWMCLTHEQKHMRLKNCYYSPQKVDDFTFIEDDKSSLFQFGMCCLHVATLEECHDIYDGYTINVHSIKDKIEKVRSIYNDDYLCDILMKMTEVRRCKRLRPNDINQLLHQMVIEQQPNHINMYPQPIPTISLVPHSQSINYSQSYKQLDNNGSLAIINQNKNTLSLSLHPGNNSTYSLEQSYNYNHQLHLNNSIENLNAKDSHQYLPSTANHSSEKKYQISNQNYLTKNLNQENIFTDPNLLDIIKFKSNHQQLFELPLNPPKGVIKIFELPSEEQQTNTELSFNNSSVFNKVQIKKDTSKKVIRVGEKSKKKDNLLKRFKL